MRSNKKSNILCILLGHKYRTPDEEAILEHCRRNIPLSTKKWVSELIPERCVRCERWKDE